MSAAHASSLRDARDRRSVLPAVSRTFALAVRLLGGSMQDVVCLAYLLCRAADTLEDAWPGSAQEIEQRFDALLAGLDGDAGPARALAAEASRLGPSRDEPGAFELLAALPDLLAALDALSGADAGAVRGGVRTLASGMRRYAARAAERGTDVPYLDDEAELHDYCYVVAGCVGEMLTALYEARRRGPDPRSAERRALAPVVGEALQLTNILLDWPSDVRRGRCHVPARWLREFGLSPADLVRPSAASRELALRLGALARGALDRVPDYLETIPARAVRYRLFCLAPALWARASLELALRQPEFPWSPSRPRIGRSTVWSELARALALAPRPGAVRRALAGAPRTLES